MLTGHSNQRQQNTSHQQICLQFSRQRHVKLKQANEQSIAMVPFEHPSRGRLKPGRITVSSHFPLGLCRAWSYVDLDINHIIFAKPQPCQIELFSHEVSNDPLNDHGQLKAGVDDYKGLRSYQQGESLKQVAWKQWAQDKGMLTKEFAEPEGAPVWLKLHNHNANELEQALSMLAWQVDKLSEKNQIFGLILGGKTIKQSNGEAHRIACQTALALFSANGVEDSAANDQDLASRANSHSQGAE